MSAPTCRSFSTRCYLLRPDTHSFPYHLFLYGILCFCFLLTISACQNDPYLEGTSNNVVVPWCSAPSDVTRIVT